MTTSRHLEKQAKHIDDPMTETMSGNKYILTLHDDPSNFLVAIPISQQDAETVAKELVLNIVLKFHTSAQILTDHGSNFLSNLFKSKYKLLTIRKIQTVAFHLEMNSSLERSNTCSTITRCRLAGGRADRQTDRQRDRQTASKKSNGARSGEYGSWGRSVGSCFERIMNQKGGKRQSIVIMQHHFFPPPLIRPFSPHCTSQPFHHLQIIFLVHHLATR
jgi:hypothetical protein